MKKELRLLTTDAIRDNSFVQFDKKEVAILTIDFQSKMKIPTFWIIESEREIPYSLLDIFLSFFFLSFSSQSIYFAPSIYLFINNVTNL